MDLRLELQKSLSAATRKVKQVADGSIPIAEFLAMYNNYYYFEALDGHEASSIPPSVLAFFPDAIRLHMRIQTEVVDLIWTGANDIIATKDSKRINGTEALYRIKKICSEEHINGILDSLRAM